MLVTLTYLITNLMKLGILAPRVPITTYIIILAAKRQRKVFSEVMEHRVVIFVVRDNNNYLCLSSKLLL
jgi:hypothetical protein